jgi:competence protein ComEA
VAERGATGTERTRARRAIENMKRVIESALCVYSLAVASLAAVTGPAPAPAELPPGPGRNTVVRVCGDCHGVDLIEGRRTRGQWRELVEDMVSRGANASEDDTKAVINYLATALGRVNVNKASESDIETVLELASPEAAAIVSYRTTAGDFKSIDDLKNVPGLDFSKVEAKKDRITFAGQ